MPNDDKIEAQCKAIYEDVIKSEGLKLVGWRSVPVVNEVVGRFAKATQPRIWQVVIEGKAGMVGDDFERELFIVRRQVEREKNAKLPADVAFDFYTCSLSTRTIVYKVRLIASPQRRADSRQQPVLVSVVSPVISAAAGQQTVSPAGADRAGMCVLCVYTQGMLRSVVLGAFYKDLRNPLYDTSFAIYHRRFSTNTTPKWPLAQPMRVLGHNGEAQVDLTGLIGWKMSDNSRQARQKHQQIDKQAPGSMRTDGGSRSPP